jgi:hypothetical protein
MTVLIEVRDYGGRVVRQCNSRCHNAKPGGKSSCVCGGLFRGLARRGQDPLAVDPNLLQIAREAAELRPGEYIQLRIGA